MWQIDVEEVQPGAGDTVNKSDEVDELVSGFLSELNALSPGADRLELEAAPQELPVINPGTSFPIVKRRDSDCPFLQDGCHPEQEELSFEVATEFLAEIGRSEGDTRIGSFIQTPAGKARVRTLCYLAGGNRNTFGAFAWLLARRSLDMNVELLMQEIDRRLSRSGESVEIYDSVNSLDQENAVVHLLRGWALYRTGRYDEALSLCDKSLQLDPDRLYAWCCRGSILSRLGRSEEALHSCEQAVALDALDSTGWTTRGMILAGLGRHQESLAAFEKGVSLGDVSQQAQFKRAQVLISLDCWREGIALLDECLGRTQSGDSETGDTGELVRALLPRLSDSLNLRLAIRLLFLVHAKHNLLPDLSRGLLDSIPDVVSSTYSDADACVWRDSWEIVAGDCPEFRMPLHLLRCAMHYRSRRDPKMLLDLPQEERSVLEHLISSR